MEPAPAAEALAGAIRFDTRHMSPHQAYEVWRSRGWPGFSAAFDVKGDPAAFFAEQSIHRLPRLLIYQQHIAGQRYTRDERMIRTDGRDQIIVQLNHSGGILACQAGERRISATQGSIAFADLSRPLDQRSAPTRSTIFLFDRDLLVDACGAELDLHGRVMQAGAAGMLADFMTSLTQKLHAGNFADPGHVERCAATVVAAILTRDLDQLHNAANALGPVVLERARHLIDQRLSDPEFTVEELAAASGVSRATLYRLFKPHGGVSRFIWDRRLEAARKLIASAGEGRTLSEIAFACGFGDEAHFSRAFRAAYGVRASDLRPWTGRKKSSPTKIKPSNGIDE